VTAQLIDGKAMAARMRAAIAAEVAAHSRANPPPTLAVVLVGADPASEIYVSSKLRQAKAVGMRSAEHRLPADTSERALLLLIDQLNADPTIDGILVQLPLPAHMDVGAVLERIDPSKDVDGFNPVNVGRVATGVARGLVPCTPMGCMMLLKSVRPQLRGLDAVMIGGSNIVGKPMARLLLAEQATVTVAHIATRDVPSLARAADIVVVAVGSPGLVRRDWIKPGATVIDVGINRLPSSDGRPGAIVGDVAFNEVREVAGAITPVPGGVGPMTIACLLLNTLRARDARAARAVTEAVSVAIA
jgi:methylenetetrahydrofolate dehydrogenase (NADP+)/methenyltetrahydrofolate cyclohydrolase